jgi:hypothetical protein
MPSCPHDHIFDPWWVFFSVAAIIWSINADTTLCDKHSLSRLIDWSIDWCHVIITLHTCIFMTRTFKTWGKITRTILQTNMTDTEVNENTCSSFDTGIITFYPALVLFEQANCIDRIIICYILSLTEIKPCRYTSGTPHQLHHSSYQRPFTAIPGTTHKNYIFPQAIRLWNQLPGIVAKADTLDSFEAQLSRATLV